MLQDSFTVLMRFVANTGAHPNSRAEPALVRKLCWWTDVKAIWPSGTLPALHFCQQSSALQSPTLAMWRLDLSTTTLARTASCFVWVQSTEFRA